MESNFKVDLIDIFKTRSWIYQCIGKGFYDIPSLEGLDCIAENNIFERLLQLGDESEGTKTLAKFFAKRSYKQENYLDKIREEHYKLFIGPGHVLCPPWESVYVSQEKIIFDEHTLDVRQFYRNWDVCVEKLNKEPDDHIGFELQFMGILSKRAIDALNIGDVNGVRKNLDAQIQFLRMHLLCWVETFCKKVLENATSLFYKGLAQFTLDFLNTDECMLNDLTISLGNLQDQGEK